MTPATQAPLQAHIEDPRERIEHAHRLVHGALSGAVASMKHDDAE